VGGVRRQWGSDVRDALPVYPAPPSARALAFGRAAVALTVVLWLVFVVITIGRLFVSRDVVFFGEASLYLVVVTLLTGSALAFLASRVGYLYRSQRHNRTPRATLDAFWEQAHPALTVLVPAYREDARIVAKTLMSAALQEYPALRVVLLIDDPPSPSDPEHAAMLEAARALPAQVEALFAGAAANARQAFDEFERRQATGAEPGLPEMNALARHYQQAVTFLTGLADRHEQVDHSDTFFADQVLTALADDLRLVADAVKEAVAAGAVLPAERLAQLYRRLCWIFEADVSSFERKQYACLSHEPNKAMNLNSYIDLMGGSYLDRETELGRVLLPVPDGGDVDVPENDYVLTLDSDSILLPEYCLRLVYMLEQPENERIAVAQTPYSAFPGAATRLERIAGATTDIQHMVHQGLTYYDATFWVGANAVLRKSALEEIAETDRLGSFEIRRFIQDRTVIEDTESTIDLGIRGWSLFNYPERLSYSATPPDFGSLCVQRQRWANGGLLIMAKMLRDNAERRAAGQRMRLGESFLRVNYMASIAWANLSLILLLVLPYSNSLLSPLVFAAALPYFVAMAYDLKSCGYKRTDILRVYAFNLMLLPVNIAGVVKSIGQGVTGQKIPFARTPKVKNRTLAPVTFVIAPYLIVLVSLYTAYHYAGDGQWSNVVFASFNAALTAYAVVAFIGIRNSLVDICVGAAHQLYRPVEEETTAPGPAAVPAPQEAPAFDWESALYYGTTNGARNGRVPARDAGTVSMTQRRAAG
jgi:cellulose synthase/poly-beta-1,6-N-acetylglucosamine synthase-like glycosyltransferase